MARNNAILIPTLNPRKKAKNNLYNSKCIFFVNKNNDTIKSDTPVQLLFRHKIFEPLFSILNVN